MTLASTPPTRVQLCGSTVIERGGERLEDRLPGRQGRLLFAYLVLNRHRVIGRDELVEALWPRALPSATEAGLNALISKLRKILGAEVIDGRSSLRLRLGPDQRLLLPASAAAQPAPCPAVPGQITDCYVLRAATSGQCYVACPSGSVMKRIWASL